MSSTVTEIIAGPADRKAAYARMEAELCRGAIVDESGVDAAIELARALFADTPPKDPILVARALGRLTLGYVDWLELHGADGVGTRARPVLDERQKELARLLASPSELARNAGIWLATVAGFYDQVPDGDESVTRWLFDAHRERVRARDPGFLERAEAAFQRAGAREVRLGAAIAWCLARARLHSYLELDGFKDVFLNSVPSSLFVESSPFRLGALGELAGDVARLGYCPSWEREKVGDDPRWFWEPEALQAPMEEPEPEPESKATETEALAADETNPYMIDAPRAGSTTHTLLGLDRVDWPSLEDAYGQAGAVPRFLQSLAATDPKEREWALGSLFAGINHQGSTYSASVEAVPFLIDLVLSPAVPAREDILRLLVGLATGEPEWALLEHKFPTLCIDRITSEAERVFPLLCDADPAVRAGVIHLLGYVEAKRDAIVPALCRALEAEEDPYLRASLVMALARVTRRSGDADDVAKVTEAATRISAESELGRAVAALCPFYARETLTQEERHRLHDLDRRGFRVHPSYAWNRGNIGAHARAIHKATMPIDEVLDALERGERDCQPRATELLFPPSTWKKEELWLPEELSPEQLRFLRWAVKQSQAYYEGIWRESGLPNTETWLKRFVGELPPGPSDRRVRVEGKGEWPIYKLVHNVQNDRVPESEWKRVASELAPDELLAVYDDLTSRDFQFDSVREYLDSLNDDDRARGVAYRDRFFALMLDVVVVRPELVKAFEARADEMLKGSDDRNFRERTLVFAGLGLAAKRAGTELAAHHADLARPGSWSPAMTLIEPLRWGLERLPLATRWHWFHDMRLVSLTRIEDVRGVRHSVRIHNGWSFLDLIPTREAVSAVEKALLVLSAHARGEDDRKHELGLTSGPLITHSEDEPLPRDAVTRIASAWGPLWQELLQTLRPRLHAELQKQLESA